MVDVGVDFAGIYVHSVFLHILTFNKTISYIIINGEINRAFFIFNIGLILAYNIVCDKMFHVKNRYFDDILFCSIKFILNTRKKKFQFEITEFKEEEENNFVCSA